MDYLSFAVHDNSGFLRYKW